MSANTPTAREHGSPGDPLDRAIEAAAHAVSDGAALFIGAGAGMGVDSGLPEFRGPGGWRDQPAVASSGVSGLQAGDARWFEQDPHVAWGFYGDRLARYRAATPHPGFAILRAWAERAVAGAFVYTSNIDGHFQRSGFGPEAIEECHGSIHHLQCARRCHDAIWSADETTVAIDEATGRARDPLPACPRCGGLARPNVMMFGDGHWVETRSVRQQSGFYRFFEALDGRPLVVIECGAGGAIPRVRWRCEELAEGGATLVRVNPREPQAPPGAISIPLGAREALERIDRALRSRGGAL